MDGYTYEQYENEICRHERLMRRLQADIEKADNEEDERMNEDE